MRTYVVALFALLPLSLAPAQQAEPEKKPEKQQAEEIPDPARVLQLWRENVRFQPVQAQPVQLEWLRANGQPVQGQQFEWVQFRGAREVGGWQAVQPVFVEWSLAPGAHVHRVPKASAALTEVEQALQAARNGADKEAVLRALDDLERAVMKARAALHETEAKGEKR